MCVRVCECARARACVCVCMRESARVRVYAVVRVSDTQNVKFNDAILKSNLLCDGNVFSRRINQTCEKNQPLVDLTITL